jgi:hypothetical protein
LPSFQTAASTAGLYLHGDWKIPRSRLFLFPVEVEVYYDAAASSSYGKKIDLSGALPPLGKQSLPGYLQSD